MKESTKTLIEEMTQEFKDKYMMYIKAKQPHNLAATDAWRSVMRMIRTRARCAPAAHITTYRAAVHYLTRNEPTISTVLARLPEAGKKVVREISSI